MQRNRTYLTNGAATAAGALCAVLFASGCLVTTSSTPPPEDTSSNKQPRARVVKRGEPQPAEPAQPTQPPPPVAEKPPAPPAEAEPAPSGPSGQVPEWRRKRLGRAARFEIEPTAGPVGTSVNVYGNFNPAVYRGAQVECTFQGAQPVTPYYISRRRIILQVPEGAQSGAVRCQVGAKSVWSGRFSVTGRVPEIFVPVDEQQGLLGAVYKIPPDTTQLPNFDKLGEPVATFVAPTLAVAPRRFDVGFPGLAAGGGGKLDEWFAIRFVGLIESTKTAEYTFQLNSDDGARLYINDQLVIDNDGVHPPTAQEGKINLPQGKHAIVVEYFQGPRYEMALELSWKRGNNPFSSVPARVLSRHSEFDCEEPPSIACCKALTPQCKACTERATAIQASWNAQCKK